MKVFLGFDVGASKTNALLADVDGNVLGFQETAGGNPEIVGYAGLTEILETSLLAVLSEANLSTNDVIAAGFGIAGFDWPTQRNDMLSAIDRLGLKAKLALANDAELGLYAGSTTGWGIVASAGTGNNVYGRDEMGHQGRITGNSVRYGEYGGASEMMFTAIQRVAYMWTGRGPETLLAELFIKATAAMNLEDLLEGLVEKRYHLDASSAYLIFDAARAGDVVAQEVLKWSAMELAESVFAVARQLSLIDKPFELVMSGSVFRNNIDYRRLFEQAVKPIAKKAVFRYLEAPPVVGAVLMALQTNGQGSQKARENLVEHFYLKRK